MPIGKPKRHYRDKKNPTKWHQIVPKEKPRKEDGMTIWEKPKKKKGWFR